MAGALARDEGTYEVDNDDPRPPVLRAVHVPVPVGPGPHGPRPQLHLRRPARPLPHDERATACCRRSASTASACRPRTPPSRPATHPRPFTDARIEELTSLLTASARVYDWRRSRQEPRPRATSAGPSGSSCASWRPAWPTATRRRSTGARAARPCWPTSRCWPTARASARATWSSKRDLEQWFFKITDYAQQLLDDLEHARLARAGR